MTTKEELVSSIKEWIKLEDEMKLLQNELKNRRIKKKMLSDKLVSVMKDNEIDCFDINNGKIIYSQNKVKSGLNKKHLLTCLSKYFENSNNPELANDITKFILESRETKIKDNIKMK